MFLSFIIIIKTSSTDQSGKNKIVYKLLTQPQKQLLHGKTEKQIQGNNQQLTASLNPSNVPVQTQFSEGDSTHESGPAGNTLQIGTFNNLIFQTLIYNKTIIHFIETRLQTTIGAIIKIQMAWLTGWQVIWLY